jgi:hypothetical protein
MIASFQITTHYPIAILHVLLAVSLATANGFVVAQPSR